MPSWTKDQALAINERGGKIIVSAAAGSGKTAVLSQRVINFVLNGGMIDRLLIVTFTKAAATEMKERIKAKVKDAYEKDKKNNHLKNQLQLVDSAMITTMDSFYGSIVKDNFEKLGIDKNKIGIGGDSAGGNLAASVTIMLKDRKQQLPVGAMLIYPVMDRRMKTESMKRYTDTPVWNAKLSKMMWKAYLKDTNADVKYASPMEAESLSFFPRTYIEVAEYDCLHDEGMDFSDRLQQEGVKVELHEEKGTCHGFEMALKSTILKNAMERRVNWLKEILYKY